MLGLCTVMSKLESGPTDIVSFLWVQYRAMRVRPCICVYICYKPRGTELICCHVLGGFLSFACFICLLKLR